MKKAKPDAKMLPAPSLAHSGLRLGTFALWLRLKRLASPTHLLVAGVIAYLLLSAAFTAAFFWPRTIAFSYSQPNCFATPMLLPNLVAKNQGQTFTATPTKTIAIAGYPLYSHTTCVTPAKAPAEKVRENISFSPLGIGFLKKSIAVSAGTLPEVRHQNALKQPVSTKDPLTLPLSSADKIFTYRLKVNGQHADCTTSQMVLACDVPKLKLEQSANYTFVMQRLFKGELDKTLFEQTVTTVGAVQLASSSITAGQTVYDKPEQMTLGFNKGIEAFEGVELNLISDESKEVIPVTAKADDNTITVQFAEALPRSASFELNVANITAPDGGHLPAPLVVPFETSGGPKVQSVNIGTYKVSTAGNVVLTFDSDVSTSQNLDSFIKLEIGGKAVAAGVTANSNRVTINPHTNLPKCARLKVRVLDGLKSAHDITGGSAWTYSSRTICQTIFSIGKSVEGRDITGYRFGSGGSHVLYVGTTHGDEKSSTRTLNSWIDYLERNHDQIPGHRTIVVIPNLNPDGYVRTSRTNAHNVDLNRNFPANNWKQGVTMPGGSFNSNGGGSSPLDEPESKALADYTLSINPRLVLTYHSAAGVVIPNDAGDSVSLAQTYGQKSNLNYQSNDQTNIIFAYDTTGSYEEWLYDKHGIPTLLVEHWTKGSNEFSGNQSAMWYTATIP